MIVLIDWLQMPGETERGIALGVVADRANVRVRFRLGADSATEIRKALLAGEPVTHELDEDSIEEISVEWEEDEDDDEEEDDDDEF